jgi:predicted Zn finger-like uncharacterized protein
MIIDCPACATRFRMDPALLPEKGRIVRCSACKHSWRQFPVTSGTQLADTNEAPIVNRIAAANQQTKQPKEEDSDHLFISQAQHSLAGKATSVTDRRVKLLLKFFLPSFSAAAALLFFFRAEIAETFPRTDKVYELFGATVKRAGVTLVEPYLQKTVDGSVEVLTVQGDLINTHRSKTLKVPPIKITLLNKANQPVKEFILNEFALSELTPGAVTAFSKTIRAYPSETVDVKLEFVNLEPPKKK